MFRKIRGSVLEKRWLKTDINVDDDPYETLAFAYNREMDQLVVANIVNNKVEEENILGLDDKKKTKGQKQHTQEVR